MKKQPKAVYIIENGGYTELTYEEFCRREQICPLYADKLFLPLYGRLMEVSKEDYAEFYRAKRRQKVFLKVLSMPLFTIYGKLSIICVM